MLRFVSFDLVNCVVPFSYYFSVQFFRLFFCVFFSGWGVIIFFYMLKLIFFFCILSDWSDEEEEEGDGAPSGRPQDSPTCWSLWKRHADFFELHNHV